MRTLAGSSHLSAATSPPISLILTHVASSTSNCPLNSRRNQAINLPFSVAIARLMWRLTGGDSHLNPRFKSRAHAPSYLISLSIACLWPIWQITTHSAR